MFLFTVYYQRLHILKLPDKLRNLNKVLINIKNDDNKCFLWCHIRHLNPLETLIERITKADRKIINNLDYGVIKFPVSKKVTARLKKKNSICISVFGFENGLIYPAYVSNETFEDCMDLLLITDDKKLHYVYIKEFNKFMYSKSKHKNEKHFRRYFLHCFSSKKILATHKNIHSLFLAVLLTKLCVLMINLANQLFFME